MKELSIDKKKKCVSSLLYIIFTLAAFSDILRIQGTSITFFRLSLPICIILISLYPKRFKQFLIILSIMAVGTVCQYIIFYRIAFPELSFNSNRFAKQIFLYFCILVFVFLIIILRDNEQDHFESRMGNFILGVGVALGMIQVISNLCPQFLGEIVLDNRNNYGCYMAAMFPFLLVRCKEKRSKSSFLLLWLCLFLIYINDSKTALVGIVIQVFVFFCIMQDLHTRKQLFKWRYGSLVLGIILLTAIFIINPNIHEYNIRETFFETIIRIVKDDPYPIYSTSITFRTNTTIYVLKQLFKTGLLGVGMGNTGVMLKEEFPDLDSSYIQALTADGLSLHNAWLEWLLDFGALMLVFYVIIIYYAVKIYFSKGILTQCEKIIVMFVFSIPVWLMGPSGIHTLYYLFCVIVFLIIGKKDRKIFATNTDN